MSLIDAGEQRVLDCLRESWFRNRARDLQPTVIDVGANRGDFVAELLARFPGPVPPQPRTFCFEPQASARDLLQERFGHLPNIAVFHFALSSEDGTANLRQTEHEACVLATLTDRDADVYDPSVKLRVVETVQTRRLDGLAQRWGLSRFDFVKLDAEGHELEILKGASWLLRERLLPVIQFEFNGCAVAAGVRVEDYWRLLSPTHDLYAIHVDGLIRAVRDYDPGEEHGEHRNYLAIARDNRWFDLPPNALGEVL